MIDFTAIFGGIGAISGIVALLTLAFFAGKYINKINTVSRSQEQCPINDIAVKVDSLWNMKDGLDAAVIKIDTMWRIYVEDNLSHHSSNPGGEMLTEEIKQDIRALIQNDQMLMRVKQPTLLVIDKIGLHRFTEAAKTNGTSLGNVLAEVDNFVCECLTT